VGGSSEADAGLGSPCGVRGNVSPIPAGEEGDFSTGISSAGWSFGGARDSVATEGSPRQDEAVALNGLLVWGSITMEDCGSGPLVARNLDVL
jgi:hypothetical protein